MSDIFKLNTNDFVRSAISAAFVAVVVAFAGIVGPDFDLFTADWIAIGKLVINTAVVTFIGRIAEKFVTAGNGKVFGRIG